MKSTLVTPEELGTLVDRIIPEITLIRRALHADPELGLREVETARLIRRLLSETQAVVLPPYLETDTVALLRGIASADTDPAAGPHLLLRADIDALPVEDECDLQWCSKNQGVSHSCGHDGHTAMLIGAALVLDRLTDRFSGTVRFVFQPAEEQLGGGRSLVEAGLLAADPAPEAAFALHSWPELPVGTFAARPGLYMAASDGFSITVKGKGGHGAKPHLAVNPVMTAALIVHMIGEAVGQSIDPLQPAVVTVCQIHAGRADNVIPETASMSGTIRYHDPRLKAVIDRRLEEIVRGCCLASGTDYRFSYRTGYIPLVNDESETAYVRDTVLKWFGPTAWDDNLEMTTSSEDFSFYLDKVPGTFIRVGTGRPEINLHNPKFDFNDEALRDGIKVLCALVLERGGLNR